ncbi:MAG TPA: arsenate reductase ArsC [Steroidobacteraceae bacterium]|nr:arsenate reductase ArsC [Steroidobacteraceae bacterium]
MSGEAARAFNVLFLCTGNSARSILAESLLNHWGAGRFRAWSAGSFPTGRVNPLALALLAQMKIEAPGARSKSWDEFARPGAPEFDFIITVCDQAAGEVCPVWPGRPLTAHWGVPDPTLATGSAAERMQAFRDTFRALEHRIRILVSLPPASFGRLRIQHELDRIGATVPPPP